MASAGTMENGEIVLAGPTEAIAADTHMKEAYLGIA